MFLTILTTIIVLGVLIFIHELGHFLAAKWAGVKVEKFAIGFGPLIKKLSYKRGDTEYSLRPIPFGGFVKMLGEDIVEDKNCEYSKEFKEKSFCCKPIYKRSIIAVAGVFFNVLLAFFLFTALYAVGTPAVVDDTSAGSVAILEIQKESPAEIAGLQVGDKIVGVSSGEIYYDAETVSGVQEFISKHKGQEIKIDYLRGETTDFVLVVPDPLVGIYMNKIGIVKMPAHKAVWEAGKDTVFWVYAITKMFVDLFIDIFKGGNMASQVAGPVGIFSIVGNVAQSGFAYLISFTAFLSINLAILNMLPLPVLDGGRLLFFVIEKIKGSPVRKKTLDLSMSISGFILILLMLIVTFNDIAKILF